MRDGVNPKRSAWGPNGRGKLERDIKLLETLQEEELEAFRRLEEQVVEERETGSARTRFSILRAIANMEDSQLIDLITLYEATVQAAAGAGAASTAAPAEPQPEEAGGDKAPSVEAKAKSVEDTASSCGAAPTEVVSEAAADLPPAPGLAEDDAQDPPRGLDPDISAPPGDNGQSSDLDAPPGLGFSSASSGVAVSSKLEATETSSTADATGPETPGTKDLGGTDTSASLDGHQDATPERSEGGQDGTPSLSPSAGTKITTAQLESWYRRRAFELRVGLEARVNSTEVLEVLKTLQDEQLSPPFTEVKMWLGLDEQEPMPEKLQTLVTEFRNLRTGQDVLPPEAHVGPVSKEPPKGGKRPSGQSPKVASYPASTKPTKAPAAWPQAGS
mmetsp:Transcript_68646/g.128054  ORF Transcript_68646/g.128054 Transcript_68646/m.128054 type:complete len:388 (+) Transcript_68646:130-1293(+)